MVEQKSPLLSVVIPVFNEERTLKLLLDKVLTLENIIGQTEIIAVNDASTDNSARILSDYQAKLGESFIVIDHVQNLGKTRSVKDGITKSRGKYVVIQDADLEYDPQEIPSLLQKALDGADVVYGNRFAGDNKVIYWTNYIGNRFLSLLSNIFTYPRIKVWIPDMEVCYKLINGNIARDIIQKITAKSSFGLEPEITAKLSKYRLMGKHLEFAVLPISYKPRTKAEGKHIRLIRDGVKAIGEVVKYNL